MLFFFVACLPRSLLRVGIGGERAAAGEEGAGGDESRRRLGGRPLRKECTRAASEVAVALCGWFFFLLVFVGCWGFMDFLGGWFLASRTELTEKLHVSDCTRPFLLTKFIYRDPRPQTGILARCLVSGELELGGGCRDNLDVP